MHRVQVISLLWHTLLGSTCADHARRAGGIETRDKAAAVPSIDSRPQLQRSAFKGLPNECRLPLCASSVTALNQLLFLVWSFYRFRCPKSPH